MNLIPYVAVWAVLALVVIVLIVYRSKIAGQEDEGLHVLDSDVAKVPVQVAIAKKLERIDRWGKLLTIIAILYALVLGGLYLYSLWLGTTRVMME